VPSSHDDSSIPVLQFGNDPSSVRGGIASVIRQHLANSDRRLLVSAIPTYDPTGPTLRKRQRHFPRALRRAVRSRRSDGVVAHVHVSQGGSLLREGLLILLLRMRRIPVVVTLHGSSSLTNGRIAFLLTGLVLHCSSVAHFLSDAHRRRYGRLARRHVVIPNSVEVASMPAAKRPDVVFAGVVGRRKGVDLLLEAWQSVDSADWCLHLYGPPDGTFLVPASAAGVVAHGEVAPETVREALATASIAVLPSREEAFPMFLLEAMAQHCAIVATDVGGVSELMGDAGALIPPDDAEALGVVLTGLIAEPAARAELGAAAGRRAAERFDSAVLSRTWAETYASLTGQQLAGKVGFSGG
jgi:glycosyltransferase involved in cell wall biosynthesis